MSNLSFQIQIGPTVLGCCDFAVCLNGSTWTCQGAWVGRHPAHDFIYAAVDLYDHFFLNPNPVKNAIWDCCVADVPGGITVRVVPDGDALVVSIFQYTAEFCPDPVQFPEIPATLGSDYKNSATLKEIQLPIPVRSPPPAVLIGFHKRTTNKNDPSQDEFLHE